jgi:hypothetical protein
LIEHRFSLEDVLEHWSPTIGWTKFKRSLIPPKIWARFHTVVQLCHCFRHWKGVADTQRDTRLPRPHFFEESGSVSRKRERDREAEISRSERHMNRAAFLADQEIAAISHLLTPQDASKPESKLYFALRTATLLDSAHKSRRFDAVAFQAFDAESELRGDVIAIAARWVKQADHPEER